MLTNSGRDLTTRVTGSSPEIRRNLANSCEGETEDLGV